MTTVATREGSFETPFPVRSLGRLLVLVDRKSPRRAYGFVLPDGCGGHITLGWLSPLSAAEAVAARQNLDDIEARWEHVEGPRWDAFLSACEEWGATGEGERPEWTENPGLAVERDVGMARFLPASCGIAQKALAFGIELDASERNQLRLYDHEKEAP